VSDSNLLKHLDNNHIGPAVLKLYDEENDWLVDVGKVDDLVLTKSVEKAFVTEVVSGVTVQSKGHSINEEWMLKGKFRELLDPNTQYLMFKNCGTPSLTETCSIQTITELLQVFSGRCRILTHNNGFYGTGILPEPTGTAVPSAVPVGTLPTTSYTVYVQAVYSGGGTSNAVACVGIAPIVLGESLIVTIIPPVGAAPESYNIYVESLINPGAILWLNTTSQNVFFTAVVTGGVAIPADGTSSLTVASEDGLTTYDVDVDYSIDPTCAGLCILADGAIEDGQWIKVTYSYFADPYTTISLGPSNRYPKYGHPVIIAMKDDDRETPAGRGIEIHLWKVDMESGFDMELSKMDFDTGYDFEWNVLFSENDLNHGEVYTYHRQFSSYGLKDLRALTEYSTADSCADAS